MIPVCRLRCTQPINWPTAPAILRRVFKQRLNEQTALHRQRNNYKRHFGMQHNLSARGNRLSTISTDVPLPPALAPGRKQPIHAGFSRSEDAGHQTHHQIHRSGIAKQRIHAGTTPARIKTSRSATDAKPSPLRTATRALRLENTMRPVIFDTEKHIKSQPTSHNHVSATFPTRAQQNHAATINENAAQSDSQQQRRLRRNQIEAASPQLEKQEGPRKQAPPHWAASRQAAPRRGSK